MNPHFRRLLTFLLWLCVPVLLWLALKDIPLQGIVTTLRQLHFWQILVLVTLNSAILVLINLRWYLILKAIRQRVSFLALMGYRLAGFAVSYFTPGTQFGGEPTQVLLLQKRNRVTSPAALSSVYLDKLLEMLSNFTFLIVGLMVLLQGGFLSLLPNAWLGWSVPIILLFPAAHLAALWSGRRPLGAGVRKLCQIFPNARLFCLVHDSVYQAEEEIIIFARQKPGLMLFAVALSAVIWGLMIFEFGLVYQFLGAEFSIMQVVIAMVLARFAFLVPVPGGLGALEASQVLAMSLLGADPSIGAAAVLWIRARDTIIGLIGAWLGAKYTRSPKQETTSSINPIF